MIVLDVDKPPVDGDTHTWADYMELLAIVNIDSVCTVEMAVDRIHDVTAEATYDESGHDEADDEEDDPHLRRRRDRSRVRFVDALAMLKWRETEYGDAYPFDVDVGERSVTLRVHFTAPQYLYVFLLVSANLPFVRNNRKELTDHFELVSKEIFKDVLPDGSEVHLFGKATAGADFGGTAFQKIAKLSVAVRGHLLSREEDYRRGDSGDSGIDIVAWHGLKDDQCNIFIYFGQCACSRSEWPRKQDEASAARLRNTLTAAPPWTTVLFVPICFRSIGGGWAVVTELGSVVMIDRLRLVRNRVDLSATAVNQEIQRIVDSVITNTEGLV